MRILFYQWNAYNLQDILASFQAMQHEVIMLTAPITNPEKDDAYTEKLCKRLTETKVDFLFSINYFPVLAEACCQTDTLYVCWNCDAPLLAMYHDSVFYPTNVIFTFELSELKEFRHFGVSNIHHLPLAVNTTRLSKQMRQTNSYVYPYPVSFVGSLYENNSYDRIAGLLPDYICGYLEGAMQAQMLVSGGNLLEPLLTDDICMKLEELTEYKKSPLSWADTRSLFASTVLGFKTASLTRHTNLNYLSMQLLRSGSGKHQVHLFTGSPTKQLPLVATHGTVNYCTEMPQVFQKSAINLNMTIPNIKTGIPLRVWDILGSGGFLLSDYQPEFDTVFLPGVHMDIFEDKEELLEKTLFYQKNDSLRQKIARQGFALVQKEHCYEVRMQTFFELLKPYL